MFKLNNYLLLSSILFCIGLTGIVLNKKNLILILVCIELIFLAINTNFLIFSNFYRTVLGEVFVFFILAIAAAETAIGLALIILFYKNFNCVNIKKMNKLKG